MDDLFVDTSGWAAYFGAREQFHATAVALLRRSQVLEARRIATNYVVAELSTLLLSPMRMSRRRRLEILGDLRSEPSLEIVSIDRTLDDEAWRLLQARPDKDWSLADCASFVVMKQRGLSNALTNDHHYEQAGFTRLLK